MISIPKLKIIRHNHEKDAKIMTTFVTTVINNRLENKQTKLQTDRNYRSERLQAKIAGVKINTCNQIQINTNKTFHSQCSSLGQVIAVLLTNFSMSISLSSL